MPTSCQENNMKYSRTLEVAISLFFFKQKPSLEGMSVLGKCEGERVTDKKKTLNETLD